jgi:hypothetical protein
VLCASSLCEIYFQYKAAISQLDAARAKYDAFFTQLKKDVDADKSSFLLILFLSVTIFPKVQCDGEDSCGDGGRTCCVRSRCHTLQEESRPKSIRSHSTFLSLSLDPLLFFSDAFCHSGSLQADSIAALEKIQCDDTATPLIYSIELLKANKDHKTNKRFALSNSCTPSLLRILCVCVCVCVRVCA